jgi:hypothetical protein
MAVGGFGPGGGVEVFGGLPHHFDEFAAAETEVYAGVCGEDGGVVGVC